MHDRSYSGCEQCRELGEDTGVCSHRCKVCYGLNLTVINNVMQFCPNIIIKKEENKS